MDANPGGLRRRPSCVVTGGRHPMVRLAGPIGRVTAERTGTSITSLIAAGERHVLVDVSAVVQSTGRLLTVLSGAHRTLTDLHGSLLIVGIQLPPFLSALETATVDEVFLFYDALRREAAAGRRGIRRDCAPSGVRRANGR